MAHSVADQRRGYPLAAYNFQVSVGELTMGFAEVSGLVREYDTVTYRHGLSAWEGELITRYRLDKFQAITLKRGVIQGMPQLRDWLEQGDRRALTVSLCDEQGLPVVVWHVQKALPTRLEAPALLAAGTEAAVETLTLMAAGISVETVA